MEIKRFESDMMASNMYLLSENGHAVVLDPCRDTSPGSGLKTDALILTHEHYDHISGVNAWKDAYGAPVICSRACAANIGPSRKNMSRYFEAFSQMQTYARQDEHVSIEKNYCCTAEFTFDDQMQFYWQDNCFELFALPGHSDGSIGIMVNRCNFFSGDSLFEEHEVELGFPGGDREKWKTISSGRLAGLPEGIIVYPGHYKEFVRRRR